MTALKVFDERKKQHYRNGGKRAEFTPDLDALDILIEVGHKATAERLAELLQGYETRIRQLLDEKEKVSE